MSTRKSGSCRNTDHAEGGSVLVESAIAIPLLILLLLVGIDLIRLGFAFSSLQYVAEQTIRRAVIATTTASQAQLFVVEEAKKYGLHIEASNMGLCPVSRTSPVECPLGTASTGAPGELLNLRIMVPIDGFVLSNKLLLSAFHTNLYASSTGEREHPA